MYNANSAISIIEFAKKLKNKTLRQVCNAEVLEHGLKGKGNFGQILEKFYFGYDLNSVSEPDFIEAGLELKSSPLKLLKNGELRSKERLVLNIINYKSVVNENFNKSSFWTKNAHLLLIFYLYDKDLNLLDYVIKLIDEWKFPKEDLDIIQRDWEVIINKIKTGKAHELSEGDTYYLGACTKGATAEKSLVVQPYNKTKAKQRAFSLKQGYVNHIIASIAQDEPAVYGKILTRPEEYVLKQPIEEVVISKFSEFYGKTVKQIQDYFNITLNIGAKHYFANLTNVILGLQLGQKIEEFSKADIIVKTVRLKPNNLPKEDISFPTFKYNEIIELEWDDSNFKNYLESKFFFVFYQYENDQLKLKEVKFWNMPYTDVVEAKKVWDSTFDIILHGNIVKEITDKGIRKTNFPNKSQNRVSHVRPHAQNANDTYELPVPDKLTGLKSYTKHCFWLNASYVRDEIYLQNKSSLPPKK